MKIGELGDKNHADPNCGSQSAVRAYPDYEPLTLCNQLRFSLDVEYNLPDKTSLLIIKSGENLKAIVSTIKSAIMTMSE